MANRLRACTALLLLGLGGGLSGCAPGWSERASAKLDALFGPSPPEHVLRAPYYVKAPGSAPDIATATNNDAAAAPSAESAGEDAAKVNAPRRLAALPTSSVGAVANALPKLRPWQEQRRDHFGKRQPVSSEPPAVGAAVKTEELQAPWAYGGAAGPKNWGKLSRAYSACFEGQEQSPIDLEREGVGAPSPPLLFQYRDEPLRIVNDGKTVSLRFSGRSMVDIEGTKYRLERAVVRTPAEHSVGGKKWPAELQLIHEDRHGRTAIVSVFVTTGLENKTLRSLAFLPQGLDEIVPSEVEVSPGLLLPDNRMRWEYQGSMTEPPCAEGVAWYVMANPITASREIMVYLESFFPNGNARPVQPKNERAVLKILEGASS